MKIALISDIHANLEALEKVLRDIEKEGVEKVHFLGDAVGYGCDPNKCVKLVNKHCDIKLLGNHDYAAMGIESLGSFNYIAQASIEWTQKELTDKSVSTLADFEMSATFLDYFLVHSSPGNPSDWDYILGTSEAEEQFEHFEQSVCLVGHSHLPTIFAKNENGKIQVDSSKTLDLKKDAKYIINVGSVGQPRDNDPRACYLIIDTEIPKIYYKRVEYNISKTQEKMRKAVLPEFLIDRIALGR
jgi:predicted phosphodiesterase